MSDNSDKAYSVYIHRNKTNNKVYIGLTKQSVSDRWGVNGVNYKGRCPRFWSAISHYGWDNFEHIIYKEGLTQEEACTCEKDLIREYKSQNKEYGYNILEGGNSPRITDDVRIKMSKSMLGNKNGLGKKCSEEKKRKISEAQKGRKFTDEHRRRISESKKGLSTFISEETKKKISESHEKKQIICETTGIVYKSIQECSRLLNIEATAICAVCKGRHKSTKGLVFRYY